MSTMGVASGRIAVARFQIQARAIAERDELADVVGAAAAGFGGHQGANRSAGAKLPRQLVESGSRTGRPSASMLVWVNRQASLTSRCGRARRRYCRRSPLVAAGTIGTPVPSMAM